MACGPWGKEKLVFTAAKGCRGWKALKSILGVGTPMLELELEESIGC
jgi:hypothetical protein